MKKMLLIISCIACAKAFAHQADTAPELWSGFKDLNKSKEACEIQSSYILDKLKVEGIVENRYGIYGRVKSNRVVVKCISTGENSSKLMVAVAGYNRDSVELVRNSIISSIN